LALTEDGETFLPHAVALSGAFRDGLDEERQRRQLDLLAKLTHRHAEENPAEKELAARIESFELAYRMQSAAPQALDVNQEPQHIQKLYGLDNKKCAHFARQCLISRRMIERGVRFVQIYSGGMENQRSWDGHNDIQGNHSGFAAETDQPIAGLLADLDQRGLLEDTLVIGHRSVVNRVSVNDLHATILHMLGIDHEKLTYRYNGRDFRLTDVAGKVIREILA